MTAAATAAALALAGLPAAAATTTAAAAPAEPGRTVTLVTGDRVALDGRGRPAVHPAPGREDIGTRVYTRAGHVHVVPIDAQPLLASGALDERLFDVTGLLDQGYDDSRGDLPLIATGPAARAQVAGVRTTRDLPAAGARALSADKSALAGSWRALATGGKLWLDGKRRMSLDRSAAQIGAPEAWQAGLTGAGVTVAVLDTGVDETHPDLAGQQVGEQNFTASADAVDRVGHGTHVASTIAGTSAKYRGIAHGAKLLDGKVLDDNGSGQDSWIVAGMEWAVQQGADIINLSLGGFDTPEVDPLEEAVNRLSAETGALFVIAAGNSGAPRTIGSPGSADAALTVGSVGRDDSLSEFSSRGPRAGDGAVKPDITAPGEDIVAAKAAQGQIGEPAEDGYVALSGTSMATPHVAGSAALLKQEHPDWTGAQLKAALIASAKPTPGLSAVEQGAGRVDVPHAMAQTTTTEPATVSMGMAVWPHDDDPVLTKQVAYRNAGTEPITLDLAVEVAGPDGAPAAPGMITVAPSTVTVPAGGTAEVELTADTARGSVDGVFSGALIATGGGQTARTAIGVEREVESYTLTETLIGTDGEPTTDASVSVNSLSGPGFAYAAPDADGRVSMRLPKGEYAIDHFFEHEDDSAEWVPAPTYAVNGDSELTIDARTAKPVSATLDVADATLNLAVISYASTTASYGPGGFASAFLLTGFGKTRTAVVAGTTPAGKVNSSVEASYTSPTSGSYSLFYPMPGAFPVGFDKRQAAAGLGTINTTVAAVPQGATLRHALVAAVPDGPASIVSAAFQPTSARVVSHVTTEGGVQWTVHTGYEGPRADDFTSPPLAVAAGGTIERRANVPVFSPSVRGSARIGLGFLRRGDELSTVAAMGSDSAGNAGRGGYTGTTRVRFGDEQVAVVPEVGYSRAEVGDRSGTFTVTTTGDRDPAYGLSTHVESSWTFESAPGEQDVRVSSIRFTPAVDDAGAARRGAFAVPLSLETETGERIAPRRVSVEVSYDEGATWAQAPVRDGAVRLKHPAHARSVSLRASAQDPRGPSTTLTVLRLYTLK
ncbi:hypothetical protein BJP25_08375 [Actinokineospora bangkokensis]|uniref:Peptidase S8/S53 domain-containing protein n=1 Tax=Actinokineospora bangkokensis TaxID=1193682 RepID=A0A1Q9LSU6_9PSEU|nr:hypothetical protein BJP25_08375 [Actinokineospora bangkokensis]